MVVKASVTGTPQKVEAILKGYPYSTTMVKGAEEGSRLTYSGLLWNKNMLGIFSKSNVMPVTVIYKAYYANNVIKEDEVQIIFDNDTGYYLLHREE